MFEPRYHIPGKVAKALMSIEADRQMVAVLPLTVPMLDLQRDKVTGSFERLKRGKVLVALRPR